MAHARRKFDESLKSLPKDADAKHLKEAKELSYCNQLFAVYHSADENHLSYDERKAFRLDNDVLHAQTLPTYCKQPENTSAS